MGVDLEADLEADLDMEDLSTGALLGSATDERLEIALGGVCRASAQNFSVFAPSSRTRSSS